MFRLACDLLQRRASRKAGNNQHNCVKFVV
jgi:hypothetical protein